MPVTPLFLHHCQRMRQATPEVAGHITQSTKEAFRAASTDLAMAQDRQLVFEVSEALARRAPQFEQALSQTITSEVDKERQEEDGTTSNTPSSISMDRLSLVDESEAETTIEIARTVQLIELKAEWELRDIQAMSATLREETVLRPQANPYRPAVYARALSKASHTLSLSEPARHLLLRTGGRELAKILQKVYADACQHLRQQGIAPLAYKAIVQPRTPKPSNVDVTQPGALPALLQRLPADNRLDPPMVAVTLDRALGNMQRGHIPSPESTFGNRSVNLQALKGLTRLLERMVLESGAQPVVQTLLRQLHTSVVRVALKDPKLIGSEHHPSWQLINEVVAYTAGFTQGDEDPLQTFLDFVQPLINGVAQASQPDTALYTQALTKVQGFIQHQNSEQLQNRQEALRRLEEADHQETLKPLLRQQVTQQLAGQTVSEGIRFFLQGAWVDVMAKAMASASHDDQDAQDLLGTVDDLLDSLQRPSSDDERDHLRRQLPHLIARLQRGMASIDMPATAQTTVLNELMAIHSRNLIGALKPKTEPTPADIVEQMRNEVLEDDVPPAGYEIDTHVGILPTVPMSLDPLNQPAQPDWLDTLESGNWCKLVLQGQWTTARLLWVSDNRQFFMFTSQHAGGMHSLTRRALLRLREEGMATRLQERSLMQRTVDSLMQDLDD
jgi:hypothetical protein